jgi:hypothetical protein
MQDPNLDEDQKFLISRRLFATMDYHTASSDCHEHWKQCKHAEDSYQRLAHTEEAGRASELVKKSMQMHLSMNKQMSCLHLRAWRLNVFAPWSDAYLTLGQRVLVFVPFVLSEGLHEPFRRIVMRFLLLIMRAEEYLAEQLKRP